jgi:hypothetical protein
MGGGSAEGNTMKHVSVRCPAMVAVTVAAHVEGCATGAALAASVGAKPALGLCHPFERDVAEQAPAALTFVLKPTNH